MREGGNGGPDALNANARMHRRQSKGCGSGGRSSIWKGQKLMQVSLLKDCKNVGFAYVKGLKINKINEQKQRGIKQHGERREQRFKVREEKHRGKRIRRGAMQREVKAEEDDRKTEKKLCGKVRAGSSSTVLC